VANQFYSFPGIVFGKKPFDWFLRRKIWISIIKITVGKSQIHHLIKGMDIINAVITHPFQIKVFQHIEHLQHDRSLHPGIEFINLNSLIGGHDRFFHINLPSGQILHRDESAFLLTAAHKFPGNITFIKSIISSIDGFFSAFSCLQCLSFSFDQFLQSLSQFWLAKNFSWIRRFSLFSGMGQKYLSRIGPLFQLFFVSLDRISCFPFYRITFGHSNSWLKNIFKL